MDFKRLYISSPSVIRKPTFLRLLWQGGCSFPLSFHPSTLWKVMSESVKFRSRQWWLIRTKRSVSRTFSTPMSFDPAPFVAYDRIWLAFLTVNRDLGSWSLIGWRTGIQTLVFLSSSDMDFARKYKNKQKSTRKSRLWYGFSKSNKKYDLKKTR